MPTKTKKIAKREEILEKFKIKPKYGDYLISFKEKSAFYRTYAMQGDGDRDMWQLLLERMLRLLSGEGIMSVLVPSQLPIEYRFDGDAKTDTGLQHTADVRL